MKLVKKVLPILALIALAALAGFGDVFKSASNADLWETFKAFVVACGPFARHVLIAGIVAYLAYWRFPHVKARLANWGATAVGHARITPRVTEVVQSSFPLLYWVATAVIVAYALDSSVFIYTGAVLVGIGYLFKSELNQLAGGIILQLSAKVKVGDLISFDNTNGPVQGTLIEIGPLYSRIQLADGELRINNYDLWGKDIKQLNAPVPVTAEAKQ